MWSPWKWEMMTVSIVSASMPAAARLVCELVDGAPLLCSVVRGTQAVSITTSLEPVLTTTWREGCA